jgi:hypothetical protein
MSNAAYNRGSRAISMQIDAEIQQRKEEAGKRLLMQQSNRGIVSVRERCQHRTIYFFEANAVCQDCGAEGIKV